MFHPAMREERYPGARLRFPAWLAGPTEELPEPERAFSVHAGRILSLLRNAAESSAGNRRLTLTVERLKDTGNEPLPDGAVRFRIVIEADGARRSFEETWKNERLSDVTPAP